MRPLSMAFAAIASSCATNWYWLGQESRVRPRGPPVAHIHECQERAHSCDCAQEWAQRIPADVGEALAEKDRRIAELETLLAEGGRSPPLGEDGEGDSEGQGAAGAADLDVVPRASAADADASIAAAAAEESDPLADLGVAWTRLDRLVKDMAAFAAAATASHIWPWAAGSAADADSAAAARDADAPQNATGPEAFLAGLAEAVPPEVWAQLRGAAARVEEAWAAAAAVVAEAAASSEERLPPEVPRFIRSARAAVGGFAEEVGAQVAATASAVHEALAVAVAEFLMHHPEHRASLEGRDPAAVLAALLCLGAFGLLEAYHLLRLAFRFVAATARGALSASTAPFRLVRACCGRSGVGGRHRRTVAATAAVAPAGAKGAESAMSAPAPTADGPRLGASALASM